MIRQLKITRKKTYIHHGEKSIPTVTGNTAILSQLASDTQHNNVNSLKLLKLRETDEVLRADVRLLKFMWLQEGPTFRWASKTLVVFHIFIRKLLQRFICTISSGPRVYEATKFIFEPGSRNILKRP